MLLKIEACMILLLYLTGILFMLLFPPRNFIQSGAKLRSVRSVGGSRKFSHFVDQKILEGVTDRMAVENLETVRTVRLKPPTAANNSIIAIELQSDAQTKKPGILIIGALNAMAWGATNAILELADKLLFDANYQTPFFNDYDWYFVPLANPDGVHFTRNMQSLRPIDSAVWSRNVTARNQTRPSHWYKNTEEEHGHKCFGININRNFAFHWQDTDDVRKLPDVCSQTYSGKRPFSSAESQAIRSYLHTIGDEIDMAILLHASFIPKKEYIMYPWRFALRLPSNYKTLQAIGEYAATQSRLPDGRLYEVHQESNEGLVAGCLTDYLAGVIGTDLVFVIKPYHPKYPNITDADTLELFVKKSISAILSLVRGWRSSTKQNTLSFFGRNVEF
ncbi:uncharacterized protein LOC126969735 isoform X1 [Leptidea sinapis]|uniref:uncharacterized protein LOC126969735 isoform X1 n=2 Tax=Leptidea sinapis TaxID=189913 RepID=UPI0021C25924|nr:uncharacterized protein LOC126969735 isoform X1 [Leptidea sinapis]